MQTSETRCEKSSKTFPEESRGRGKIGFSMDAVTPSSRHHSEKYAPIKNLPRSASSTSRRTTTDDATVATQK
jgi:hypothetical protein